jgi:hypothetical protein
MARIKLAENMLKFPVDFFYRWASYMINTLCGSNPDRPVACITLFPYSREFGDTFIGLGSGRAR